MTAQATIIGLGEAGKNIANILRQYEEYDVHTIDSEGDPDHLIPAEPGPEEYEKDYSDLDLYDEIDTEEILFFFSGAGDISGAAGPLWEPFSHIEDGKTQLEKDVKVYYIQPDIDFLSPEEQKKERVARNAFMQMTRSAVFDRMFFFSNPKMEDILGGVPAIEYYEQINELITHTVHSHNYYKNTEPVFGKLRKPDRICRLSTLGVVIDDQEKYFFDLKLPAEKEFYFTFPEEVLREDDDLISNLKQTMKEKREGELNIDSLSYGLYKANYDQARHLCVSNTHVDQSLELEGE